MAYTDPTADQLQAKYPAFAAVPDATVDLYIADAKRMVDQTWTEGDYATAIMLYACHLMVLAGLGTGAEAQANAEGLAGFSTIRSGQLTLQRGATSGADGIPSEFAGSQYGRQFYALLKRNKGSVAVANGGAPLNDAYGAYPYGSPARLWPYH